MKINNREKARILRGIGRVGRITWNTKVHRDRGKYYRPTEKRKDYEVRKYK